MTIIIATRGPLIGQCNICGDHGRLTEDHTPPKGCIRVGQVEILHIVNRLGTDSPISKGRFSQNGIKYRTLCHRCNNSLLGANYDPAFNSFVNTVGTFLKSPLKLPSTMSVKGQPQKIMRAVLGHLSALGVDRYMKGPDTEPLRDYFLVGTRPLPEWINIYYWVYPYKGQILVRDCAYLDIPIGKPVVTWFMKFFPIAFMVTWNEPPEYDFGLPNLAKWRTSLLDDEVELPVPLSRIVHQYWPEAPTEQSVVTYGREAVMALDRQKGQSPNRVSIVCHSSGGKTHTP